MVLARITLLPQNVLCIQGLNGFIDEWPWPILKVIDIDLIKTWPEVKNQISIKCFQFRTNYASVCPGKVFYKKWPWPIFKVMKGHNSLQHLRWLWTFLWYVATGTSGPLQTLAVTFDASLICGAGDSCVLWMPCFSDLLLFKIIVPRSQGMYRTQLIGGNPPCGWPTRVNYFLTW